MDPCVNFVTSEVAELMMWMSIHFVQASTKIRNILPKKLQHSQHGLLTMVFIAIPMGAKDRLRLLASGLAGEAGFHCLLDLSINTRLPHMLSAKTLQSSGLRVGFV